ncbi:hypothetical protein PORCRE_732 [Porphyromonas crevioricanis JCM 15906]|uniref:Uncharacterized protein n=2 Tax=Porphyromonas crevioricanis TaxID=393921 RepID=A0A2X4PIH2_9PORP|nr:hypothetical protein [Porphyromonas crevioricanis]GAD05035.1 hypothetical protein PORCRE_732 [Porphyromonas crevioricanis JCM 15906]GAD08156.1 hypothetical protein PORCAN_1792 [Porphyromonas crevioricanis JCM 13913]SJZ96726.1 hypothetical protein SAMN02745203_01430 [Porphyromonas crevioricanis]SQH73744.1 Uncharacterised protein [Porphyromonas crevioricanis]
MKAKDVECVAQHLTSFTDAVIYSTIKFESIFDQSRYLLEINGGSSLIKYRI